MPSAPPPLDRLADHPGMRKVGLTFKGSCGVADGPVKVHSPKGGFFLHCPDDTLRRVGNADRVARRKMTSPDTLRRELGIYDFAPVRPDCLKLDTSQLTAEAAAARIVDHFELAPPAPDRTA